MQQEDHATIDANLIQHATQFTFLPYDVSRNGAKEMIVEQRTLSDKKVVWVIRNRFYLLSRREEYYYTECLAEYLAKKDIIVEVGTINYILESKWYFSYSWTLAPERNNLYWETAQQAIEYVMQHLQQHPDGIKT